MFTWRVNERLGYQVIADRLNTDLVLNPPPVPVDPERSIGRWTYSNVRDVLTNPKHTGHMGWNRRARKGAGKNRMNPVSEWVWSPQPVHEALVGLETFVQAQEISAHRERSRSAPGLSPAPQANRVYPLRSTCVMAVVVLQLTTAMRVMPPHPGPRPRSALLPRRRRSPGPA
jgi:site-specific DNA recombinase